ncbi:hypothetical protein EYF80_025159 [Liparis tanakae]|uniref:Uncharacterized protein n=1 Tax=Liparis tanakae TaxID=230148 RepID=A0A4Z2HGJ4_9TELE|nr:hypothetical protein EYF80_025159 [Liparis tanakae]
MTKAAGKCGGEILENILRLISSYSCPPTRLTHRRRGGREEEGSTLSHEVHLRPMIQALDSKYDPLKITSLSGVTL